MLGYFCLFFVDFTQLITEHADFNFNHPSNFHLRDFPELAIWICPRLYLIKYLPFNFNNLPHEHSRTLHN
jgi:hypothetical protein